MSDTNIMKMARDKTPDLFATAKNTLLDFALNVSARDKVEAAAKLDFSPRTVERYLKGDVRDLDTATQLIEFFKEKISKREKQIAA